MCEGGGGARGLLLFIFIIQGFLSNFGMVRTIHAVDWFGFSCGGLFIFISLRRAFPHALMCRPCCFSQPLSF